MKNCSRPLAALLASALLATGAVACGSSGPSASARAGAGSSRATSTSSSAAGGYLREDGDEDADETSTAEGDQDDQTQLASYGPKAGPATTRAIANILRRYYAAAAAGDGDGACALLNAALAASLAAAAGPTGKDAHTCAAGIAPVLAQQHQRLLAEQPATMTVIAVYAKGGLALATLGFKHAPESDILLTRAGSAWKIDALYDSLMT
jgi:hypothetical protein